jgi:hypothetical protein
MQVGEWIYNYLGLLLARSLLIFLKTAQKICHDSTTPFHHRRRGGRRRCACCPAGRPEVT